MVAEKETNYSLLYELGWKREKEIETKEFRMFPGFGQMHLNSANLQRAGGYPGLAGRMNIPFGESQIKGFRSGII